MAGPRTLHSLSMQELEALLRFPDARQVLATAIAWPDKRKREAVTWLVSHWKRHSEAIEAASQTGSTQWINMVVINAALAKTVRQALAIRPPGSHHTGIRNLDARCDPHAANAGGKIALFAALAGHGREWVADYLTAVQGGETRKPMYIDLLLALASGFDLPLPDEASVLQAWGAYFWTVLDRPRWPEDAPPYYPRQVSRLEVARTKDGNPALKAETITVATPEQAAEILFALPEMMRLIFSVRDGSLSLLHGYFDQNSADQVAAIVAVLIDRSVLDRTQLAADAVAALTRGDSVNAQRMNVRLLMAANPGPAILAPHADTLCSILASGHGTSADCAQTLLRRLDAAQPLGEELFGHACQIVFARKEKGLCKTQLAWASAWLARDPKRLQAGLHGIAHALAASDFVLQRAAADKLLAYRDRLTPDMRNVIAGHVRLCEGMLDASLYAELLNALGQDVETSGGASYTQPSLEAGPSHCIPFNPIEMPDDAALARVRANQLNYSKEQILDLAVRLSNDGRQAAARTLLSHIESGQWFDALHSELSLVARKRSREAIAALNEGRYYALLSRPSYAHGAISQNDLLSRLRELGTQQKAAEPLDFLAALMRTQDFDAAGIEALRRIGSPQAGIAARFFAAGGMTQLRTHWRVVGSEVPCPYKDDHHWPSATGREICITLEGMAELPEIDGIPVGWARGFTPTTVPHVYPFDLVRELLTDVLPSHGEPLAALYLWGFRKAGLAYNSDGGRETARALPLFLDAGGPAGPALHLAVLYCMSANDAEGRLAGSDGLLTLITQGRYDGSLASRLTAAAIDCGSLKAGRLAASLEQVASAGAQAQVWPLLRAAITTALARDDKPAGTHQLLALASRLAPALNAHDTIPGLAGTAARKGSTKLIMEARRLHQLLANEGASS